MLDRRHHHGHHGHHGLGLLRTSLALGVTAFLLGYAALEKKLLPRAWWAPMSKFYFYPLMLPNLFVRIASRRPYFSNVDSNVVMGGVPMVIAGHVAALHADGVRAVVNMQAEYIGPVDAYAKLRPPIEQLRLPVVDHTEPTLEQLEAAVAFITQHVERGDRVLIHCKGGHGRSAAVAMAWLLSAPGGSLTPEEAQKHLSSIRSVRSSLYKQEALLEFYELHRRHPEAPRSTT